MLFLFQIHKHFLRRIPPKHKKTEKFLKIFPKVAQKQERNVNLLLQKKRKSTILESNSSYGISVHRPAEPSETVMAGMQTRNGARFIRKCKGKQAWTAKLKKTEKQTGTKIS